MNQIKFINYSLQEILAFTNDYIKDKDDKNSETILNFISELTGISPDSILAIGNKNE